MMASGVFSSWAAEASASRQQLQCSSLNSSSVCFTGDIFADCMGTASFLSLGSGNVSPVSSVRFPELCSIAPTLDKNSHRV